MDTKIKELLQQIVKNTSPKEQHQIIVSNNKANFYTSLDTPLKLDPSKNYEVALTKLYTYFSFPNINERNNIIEYTKGDENKTIAIPIGSYGIKGLNKAISSELKAAGDNDALYLQANLNLLKTILLVKPGYIVKFNHSNSIKKILGFEKDEYPSGRHVSENVIDIFPVSSIFIHTNLSGDSIVNRVREPVIYSFFPKVNPGYKIIETPNALTYLPMQTWTISNIHIKVTDQDNNLLDLRNERITIIFHIREY